MRIERKTTTRGLLHFFTERRKRKRLANETNFHKQVMMGKRLREREEKIWKRLKGNRVIHGCVSPRTVYARRSSFSWYDEDIWTYVARFLEGRSIVMLGATSKWFHKVIMDESVWKYACLRDLQVPTSFPVSYSWIKIYASAFDGSHSYLFHQEEKHIDWIRIGAFSINSTASLLTERLKTPVKIPNEGTLDHKLQLWGSCVLDNVKRGIWIADLQLVRCPVCDLSSCDGTMQTLDARHVELFLNTAYLESIWEYELIGSHKIQKDVDAACGAIFDLEHLRGDSSAGIFNLNSWTGKAGDSQPKAVIASHAVAVHTRLQQNEGILVKYHVMRAGKGGEAVSIRISQQLL